MGSSDASFTAAAASAAASNMYGPTALSNYNIIPTSSAYHQCLHSPTQHHAAAGNLQLPSQQQSEMRHLGFYRSLGAQENLVSNPTFNDTIAPYQQYYTPAFHQGGDGGGGGSGLGLLGTTPGASDVVGREQIYQEGAMSSAGPTQLSSTQNLDAITAEDIQRKILLLQHQQQFAMSALAQSQHEMMMAQASNKFESAAAASAGMPFDASVNAPPVGPVVADDNAGNVVVGPFPGFSQLVINASSNPMGGINFADYQQRLQEGQKRWGAGAAIPQSSTATAGSSPSVGSGIAHRDLLPASAHPLQTPTRKDHSSSSGSGEKGKEKEGTP